jgi:hypothetical protein
MFNLIKQAFSKALHVAICTIAVTASSFAQRPAASATTIKPSVAASTATPTLAASALTKADYKECFAFLSKLDRKNGLDANLKIFNSFVAKRFGVKINITAQQILDRQHNAFIDGSNSMMAYLNLAKTSGKISESVYTVYKDLDSKMPKIKTFAEGVSILQTAQKDIASGKYTFDKTDKINTLAQLTVLEAHYEYRAGAAGTIAMVANEPCEMEQWVAESEMVEGRFEGDEPYLHTTMTLVSTPCGGGGGGSSPSTPSCATCPTGWYLRFSNSCQPNNPNYVAPGDVMAFNGSFYYKSVVAANGSRQCPLSATAPAPPAYLALDGMSCWFMAIPSGYHMTPLGTNVTHTNLFSLQPICP